VLLSRQEDSIAFLDYMYPEHLLLPNNKTLANLFDILETRGHYGGATLKGKRMKQWTQYPLANQGKNSNRGAQLAKFLNRLRAAVHEVCGISCL